MMCDATCPPYTPRSMNIIFMDAPYREELWEKALMALDSKGWIDDYSLDSFMLCLCLFLICFIVFVLILDIWFD